MRIGTQRTYLRRFNMADFEFVRQLESDPEIMKFTPSRVPKTESETQARLKKWVDDEPKWAPLGIWGAFENLNDHFIGWLMLQKSKMMFPELGFMLIQRQWGKGFATETAGALLSFGIQTLKLEGISACTDPDNFRSIRVLQKLGFVATGPDGDGVLTQFVYPASKVSTQMENEP